MSQLGPDARAVLLSELQSLSKRTTAEASARLLTAVQVALLFGVSERTIRIWANKDWIPAIRTPSGHWKFPALEILHTYEINSQKGQLTSKRRPRTTTSENRRLLADG